MIPIWRLGRYRVIYPDGRSAFESSGGRARCLRARWRQGRSTPSRTPAKQVPSERVMDKQSSETAMDEIDLAPDAIRIINSANDTEFLARLVESMRKEGWKGRRLLVEESVQHRVSQYFAWTGSHRLEAAKEVGLLTVPCLVILAAEAETAFVRAISSAMATLVGVTHRRRRPLPGPAKARGAQAGGPDAGISSLGARPQRN